jgi:hypothetical protein
MFGVGARLDPAEAPDSVWWVAPDVDRRGKRQGEYLYPRYGLRTALMIESAWQGYVCFDLAEN